MTMRSQPARVLSGDRLRVAVESGVVVYSRNGSVFYTSAVAPTYPLLVDTSLHTTGATISNAFIFGSGPPTFTVAISDVVVTEGRPIESLRRVKEDVKEVRSGTECGIKLAGFDDVKVGDRLVCYKTISVSRKLS